MNPTLMNSPCSCLSVYQPCRGPQTDVSGPEPCPFRVGTSSMVGHSISGPGPNQCDPMPTRRRQTVDKQSGPYSSQIRSKSSTSAGAQLGSAVWQHDYDGVPVQSTYFHNSKLPATLISFYIAGETISAPNLLRGMAKLRLMRGFANSFLRPNNLRLTHYVATLLMNTNLVR